MNRGGTTRDRNNAGEKLNGLAADGSRQPSRVSYAMTLHFEEAGRDDGSKPRVTPFSMNRWLVPPASAGGGSPAGNRQDVTPPVDIRMGREEIKLVAEMPGMRPEDIDILVLPGAIRIVGETTVGHDDADPGVRYVERVLDAGRARRFTGTAAPPGAKASFVNGVLELRLTRRMVLHGRMASRIPVR